MFFNLWSHPAWLHAFVCNVLLTSAQPIPIPADFLSWLQSLFSSSSPDSVDLDIKVIGLDKTPLDDAAVVTLLKADGEFYRQGTTKAGCLKFSEIAPAEYNIHVVAATYESAAKRLDARVPSAREVTIELRPVTDTDAPSRAGPASQLSPKAQKELGKALDALRSNNTSKARSHLDAAYHLAADHPEVNYVSGVFWLQLNEVAHAKASWLRTLDLNPSHLMALLSLTEIFLRENDTTNAMAMAKRAGEVEPSSWRVRALLANAYLQQGSFGQAVEQAQRALELGDEQASAVQPLLAAALAKHGEYDRARDVLQTYLRQYPEDVAANEQLTTLRNPLSAASRNMLPMVISVASTLPLPSNWLPPNVDDRIPRVDPNTPCRVNEVVQRAGDRVQELVRNVDRYTATEKLVHESIDKWGMVSSSEDRVFEYVASIEEVRPGVLNVDEYRRSRRSEDQSPGGVQTTGLALLSLIFHPHLSENFEITCEGLTRWGGQLAWQVHFRQRNDKPNTIQSYRVGWNGPSYAVGLRGRAWIDVDTYQIQRLETDLINPAPAIRLVSDHTIIQYGAVHFRERNIDMWLPQSAELYYEWRGRRAHRRHSFSNFLLFSVDDKQRISAPKTLRSSN